MATESPVASSGENSRVYAGRPGQGLAEKGGRARYRIGHTREPRREGSACRNLRQGRRTDLRRRGMRSVEGRSRDKLRAVSGEPWRSSWPDVSLGAQRAEGLQAVAHKTEAVGARSLMNPMDVTDSSQVTDFVCRTVAELCGLNIVVNYAAVPSSTALLDTTDTDWERTLNTNLLWTFLVTQAAGRHIVPPGSSKIVIAVFNFAFKNVARRRTS